jgi:Fe(3+) dicitrate transport protein
MIVSLSLFGRNSESDTVRLKDEIVVEANYYPKSILKMDSINGLFIIRGKKNEVIDLNQSNSNITEKNTRQIFSKVPGVFVYDMDGNGNQVNIGVRGLDAHRGWEFNIRKDGIITNSDLYGYPASHFSPPMESFEKIELIRGTSSLQYGSQFGGMLNYVSKKVDTSKLINIETINSIASFNTLTTYNSIGGKIGNLVYNAYFSRRTSDGYRNNSSSDYDAQQVSLNYIFNNDINLKLEFARTSYLYQLPGQLNDSMFLIDPRQSTRTRNFYSPTIYLPSITFNWNIDSNTIMLFTSSLLNGNRNSILFDKPANIRDSINHITLNYNNRQVDIDEFNSFSNELRVLYKYNLWGTNGQLASGLQFLRNNMLRKQLGVGSNSLDYNLSVDSSGFIRDMSFNSTNIGFYIENSINLTNELTYNIGYRIDHGNTKLNGEITYFPDNELPTTINRNINILSSSINYKLDETVKLYSAFSQSYRPVIFKDIIPATTYDRIDKNLKDAFGYNFEIGFSGNKDYLIWDISYFALQYNNRLGNLAFTDSVGNLGIYKTNIGNSFTYGLEIYIEYYYQLMKDLKLSLFNASSIMDARYQDARIKVGNINKDITNNKVESTPSIISRSGITFYYSKFQLSFLANYVSESYADALNTELPNQSGAIGKVPSYFIADLNSSFKYSETIKLGFNISNLFDKSYFTKRPLFYPGPGIWPSDGRSFNLTFFYLF